MGIPHRLRFDITTDTGGDGSATSAPCEGLIMQIRSDTGIWDTGCDVRLEALNSDGSRMTIAHYENVGGAAWTRVPRILSYDTGGTEVGDQPPLVAHDQLVLTVTQSAGVTGSLTGTFWVWVGW
jgi:hypothetical protein